MQFNTNRGRQLQVDIGARNKHAIDLDGDAIQIGWTHLAQSE